MITIHTYIKNSKKIKSLSKINEEYSDYFIACEDEKCLEFIKDYDYIEGAIIIKSDNTSILDFTYWDLVDQLWSYILSGINDMADGKRIVKFYFPDQPIEFQMQEASPSLLMLRIQDKVFYVSKQEFIFNILQESERFFYILSKSEDKDACSQALEEIALIKKIREYESQDNQ